MTPAATPIRAVIFDMGGTLEQVYYDDDYRLKATTAFQALLIQRAIDPGLSVPELYAVLKAGIRRYQNWREMTELELPPERLWSEYVFADLDLPRDRLAACGEELALYWDTHFSKRGLRPEAPAMLGALHARGFQLGVISNIMSREAVPLSLADYGIGQYFGAVLASAVFGWRKPNPRIFLEAARLLNVLPAQCAYVGDTVSRDVIGTRRAGYGLAIQIKSFLTKQSDLDSHDEIPDAIVENLMQVVDLVDHSREHTQ